jgi:hypothetical protein
LADDQSNVSVGAGYCKFGNDLPRSGRPAMTFIDFIPVRMQRIANPLLNLPFNYLKYWVDYTWLCV